MAPQEVGALNESKRGQRADLDSVSRSRADTSEFPNVTNVEHMLGIKKSLPHGWDEVCSPSQHANPEIVLCQISDGLFHRAWPY
jgi:hypothetical protein